MPILADLIDARSVVEITSGAIVAGVSLAGFLRRRRTEADRLRDDEKAKREADTAAIKAQAEKDLLARQLDEAQTKDVNDLKAGQAAQLAATQAGVQAIRDQAKMLDAIAQDTSDQKKELHEHARLDMEEFDKIHKKLEQRGAKLDAESLKLEALSAKVDALEEHVGSLALTLGRFGATE